MHSFIPHMILLHWRKHQTQHFPTANLLDSKHYTNWLCNPRIASLPLMGAATPSPGCL